jgi:hypothetical protein
LNGKKLEKSIYRPTQKYVQWRACNNNKISGLHNDTDVLTHIKLRRLEWGGHICRIDISRAPKKTLEGKTHGCQPIGKPKDK